MTCLLARGRGRVGRILSHLGHKEPHSPVFCTFRNTPLWNYNLSVSVSASFTVYQEFDHLLEEQSPIESYIEWLDTMVDRCVVKVGRAKQKGQPWLLPMGGCL